MTKARLPRLLAPALLLLAGCSDTSGPDPLKRVYVLSTVAGRPLPQSVEQSYPDGTRRVHTVLADTLVFVSDSILHRRGEQLVSEYESSGRLVFGSSQRIDKSGRYRRRGEIVFVTWVPQGRDTLWHGSGTMVASENVGAACITCQPLLQTLEFVYR